MATDTGRDPAASLLADTPPTQLINLLGFLVVVLGEDLEPGRGPVLAHYDDRGLDAGQRG